MINKFVFNKREKSNELLDFDQIIKSIIFMVQNMYVSVFDTKPFLPPRNQSEEVLA